MSELLASGRSCRNGDSLDIGTWADRAIAEMLAVPTERFSHFVDGMATSRRNCVAWWLQMEVSSFIAASLSERW